MQDNKNMILAIALCLAVLFGWGRLAEYMGWITPPTQQVAQQTGQQDGQPAPQQQAPPTPVEPEPTFVPAPGQDVSVKTPLYEAVLYSGGGILRSFSLRLYGTGHDAGAPRVNMVSAQTAATAPLGLVINGQPSWSTGRWAPDADAGNFNLESGGRASLRLKGEVDNLRVEREFSFSADTYLIQEKVRVKNHGTQFRGLRLGYTAAADASNSSDDRYDGMRVAWDKDGSLAEESSAKTLESSGAQDSGKIYWAGPMSTYFLAAVVPDVPVGGMTVKARLQQHVYRAALEEPETSLAPGEEKIFAVSYWFGPKERESLNAVSPELAKSIDLGMFSLIAKGLLWLLQIFYSWVHNWGVAIIFLTLIIKAVFWPLTAKSYSSMEKMKKLQPMMNTLKEKYKDDKERMNKEVMALYKTYGVNPASGCVPILIQLPVFFGLYQALLTAIELRHAPFIVHLPFTDIVWLADLSAKDPYYITPVIMGVTMFLQQKMSPPPADPMQQKIMMFLPLIFTVLFLSFPSGLVIYWLVNNILSIAQQWMMIRKNSANRA
ncbi:MAG: membrane protein insertase YidC [Desulfovibrio sp.]|jgi:YidC/Oxa1 family membrane protein insertase|nr:membrane protein insertase YidC [Desulfovibrio sp.]